MPVVLAIRRTAARRDLRAAWFRRLAPILLAAGCGGNAAPPPPATPPPATPAPTPTPVVLNLGAHTWTITTSSAEAQAAFNRGINLTYAFNHPAAEREFRRALASDPAAAMAWWGIALVNGPHINNPVMSPEQVRTAWEALAKARELQAHASEPEQALIAALARRYVEDPEADRKPLDQAYAEAMRAAWEAHPQHADMGALAAEALMDLRPWDLWTAGGKPQPGTEQVVTLLEKVLALDPRHPLANHLYIHALEASPDVARAVPAADVLRDLVPDAGHLVHMPGHIYVRVGRWADGATVNVAAIAADARFRQAEPQEPGFYRVYMAHNHSFLSFVEMMRGRRESATRAAREMVAEIPEEFAREAAPLADGILGLPLSVLMRFGRWDDILAEPEPPEWRPLSRAMRLFARGAALAAQGKTDEAEKERTAFRAAAQAVPEHFAMGNNPAHLVLEVAARVLDGEIAAARGDLKEAAASLRQAARLEDGLKYDEPPDWVQPVRHTLGAVLLRAGLPAEAEKAYREDLNRFPENGWSLFGLGRALRLQKKDKEAAEVEERFKKAWTDADTTIGATCLCQPPT